MASQKSDAWSVRIIKSKLVNKQYSPLILISISSFSLLIWFSFLILLNKSQPSHFIGREIRIGERWARERAHIIEKVGTYGYLLVWTHISVHCQVIIMCAFEKKIVVYKMVFLKNQKTRVLLSHPWWPHPFDFLLLCKNTHFKLRNGEDMSKSYSPALKKKKKMKSDNPVLSRHSLECIFGWSWNPTDCAPSPIHSIHLYFYTFDTPTTSISLFWPNSDRIRSESVDSVGVRLHLFIPKYYYQILLLL